MYTNTLELRVYGLMRSGNHAIIEWILAQHAGHPCCFLNNVAHGDRDPYVTAGRKILKGIDNDVDLEFLRRLPKRLLVYSYEDRLDAERPGVNFIDSVFDPDFQASRAGYLGASDRAMDVLILRDPFNCLASRMELLATRGALGGSADIARIVDNWKLLAQRAEALQQHHEPGALFVNYNRWAVDQAYRRQLSGKLEGRFSDATMGRMSGFGGGSSFDVQPLGVAEVPGQWRKLFRARNWLRLAHFYRRFTAPPLQGKVTERWLAYRDDPAFREAMRDPAVLAASERLFGELPGTRAFVDGP